MRSLPVAHYNCGRMVAKLPRPRAASVRRDCGAKLRLPRRSGLETEQAAGLWLGGECIGIKAFAGRGGIDGLQAGAAEGQLGDIGRGKGNALQQPAVGRIAPSRPAAEKPRPQSTL